MTDCTTSIWTPKDPADNDAFWMDFTPPLRAAGDTITGTPTLASNPAGLTFSSITIRTGGKIVDFMIAGGVAGTTYQVACVIVTSTAGRSLTRRVTLLVKNR